MKKIALLSLVLAMSSAAFASGLYAVGTICRADYANSSNVVKGFQDQLSNIASKDKDLAYKLQLGYQVDAHWAVEGGYVNLGQNTSAATTANGVAKVNGSTKVQGLNVDLVGSLPITERWAVYGKVGAFYSHAKADSSAQGLALPTSFSDTRDALSPTWGVGTAFDLTDSVALRAEYEQFRNQGADASQGTVNLFSLGMAYKF